MNDADLNENIDEHVAQLEDQKAGMRRFENDGCHLTPTRWWFASSAFPMIAGTLGPVASAFSICALARPWRQYVPDGTRIQDATFVKDPEWLIVVNALQLVIAVISNVFLLLNMARRVRFSIAQPITIVGWYISSICLLALNATAAGPLRLSPQEDYAWSQAFYYGMFAAILYFLDASLMVVTVWGAYARYYAKDFQLTSSQRTLMLQTIMYLFYLLVGALVFSTIEGWVYLDGVYWANTTLFTVGFGDFVPTTTLARALQIPYSLIGIITLGLLIGSIRSMVLERGHRRLDARMTEKHRRRIIRNMTRKGQDAILEPILGDRSAATGDPDGTARGGPEGVPVTEFARRRAEFRLMRRIQGRASVRRRWLGMSTSLIVWLVLWLVGAKLFQEAERPYQDWSYFDAFYFSFITLSTVGYGDITLISPAGRSFYVFWSLLALPTMTIMISNAGDTIVLAVKNATLDLGNITILPSKRGFKRDTQIILRKLSGGLLFPRRRSGDEDNGRSGSEDSESDDSESDEVEELPPGFFTASRPLCSSNRSNHSLHSHRSTPDTNHKVEETASAGRRRSPSDAASRAHRPSATSFSSSRELRPRHRNRQTQQEDALRLDDRRSQAVRSDRTDRPHPRGQERSPSRARSRVRDPTTALPPVTSPDYQYILISEIATVTRDLQRKESKRYTFTEWAWYLKLIGEDEANPATHRKARPHVEGTRLVDVDVGPTIRKEVPPGRGGSIGNNNLDGNASRSAAPRRDMSTATSTVGAKAKHSRRHEHRNGQLLFSTERNGEGDDFEGENHGDMETFVAEGDKWSWVGSRSPLMGSQEESEWILHKLTEKLKHLLDVARRAPAESSETG